MSDPDLRSATGTRADLVIWATGPLHWPSLMIGRCVLAGPVELAPVDPQWSSVGDLVRWAARRFGDREYLRFPDGGLSFAAVDAYSERLAARLAAAGAGPGD